MSNKRELCRVCTRPVALCYCKFIHSINNKVRVLLIQHPTETKHPFNTGRIVASSLNQCDWVIEECVSEQTQSIIDSHNALLLYPKPLSALKTYTESTIKLNEYGQVNYLSTCFDLEKITLMVAIDANWRKSKKIFKLNPCLQQLPILQLTGYLNSKYHIRRSKITNSLSTIESVAVGLNILEPSFPFNRFLIPFNQFILSQRKYHPT